MRRFSTHVFNPNTNLLAKVQQIGSNDYLKHLLLKIKLFFNRPKINDASILGMTKHDSLMQIYRFKTEIFLRRSVH